MSSAYQSPSTPRRSASRKATPPDLGDGSTQTQSIAPKSDQSSPVLLRPNSMQQHQNRPPSSSRQAQLATVARRDFEQTNLPQASSPSARRSSSLDRNANDRFRSQTPDSPKSAQRASSRGATRHNSGLDARHAPHVNGTASEHGQRHSSSATATDRKDIKDGRRIQVQCQTGTWSLSKTVGAGSMGKVKLAKNLETGEQAAIKIVPRYSSEEYRNEADRIRAEHSKEVRTQREAAIVSLVNHPYICGMRDVLKTHHHWYMLFEYVNGGQMLDYIISHGRLKEKQARKFGRQIASALDYCHRNSIVHRDLKIENILISKTGDIKIIDFGLSNLFSPRNILKTFCGSLYFAAPELLNAKQYTGPEVDVWSFGIVLYVLVCGKVPFDDQSMPQLHAKIKKGAVEYPPWLSTECKHIISRMLVTDPKNRALLSEIMNHPWMTKGTSGPPENFLPLREPLQLPLDDKVIEKMTGFEFGPPEWIKNQLESTINSDDYQRAVRLYAKRHQTHSTDSTNKRASVFDFYQRRRSNISKDGLANPSTETIPSGEDPVNAFHPLLSIYYLVREKQQREKQETNPGATSIPLAPGEKPLAFPGLPGPPQAAYTNSHAMEMKGEAPTGGRARPRARTQGEDEIDSEKQRVPTKPSEAQSATPTINEPPARSPPPPSKRESGAAGLFRRLSTRRNRDSDVRDSFKGSPPPRLSTTGEEKDLEKNTLSTATAPNPTRHSFSIRKTRDRETPPSSYRPPPNETGVQQTPDSPAPPDTAQESSPPPEPERGSPNRLRKGLGRSASVNSSDLRRRWSARKGLSEGQALKRRSGAGSDRTSFLGTQKAAEIRGGTASDREAEAPLRHSFTNRTRSLGHGRRASLQPRKSERSQRDHTAAPRESDVPEETDAELAAEEAEDAGYSSTEPPTSRITGGVSRYGGESQETLKPVYLKGLFSVSTTSSKPLNVIRSDIIRVLRQLGVDYKEMKGGFSCRHAPSIDVGSRGKDDEGEEKSQLSTTIQTHRRKISFAGLRNNDRQREEAKNDEEKVVTPDPEKGPTTPRTAVMARAASHTGPSTAASTAYTSYNNSEAEDSEVEPHEKEDGDNAPLRKSTTLRKRNSRLSASSARDKVEHRPVGEPKDRMAGETTTHVQSDMGSRSLVLKFEILVVKVPILSLHGLQFKKVEGGTWQYKRMADRILGELRL